MNICYLLPTNRDWKTQGELVAHNVLSMQSKHNCRLAVFSETDPEFSEDWIRRKTNWLKETGKEGPIKGFNKLAQVESANDTDYFVCLTDDIQLINTIDHAIDFLQGPFFEDRKYKITSLNPGNFCVTPGKGEVMGDQAIEFDCPKFPLVRFPILTVETFKLLGNIIFTEECFSHGPDNFLGFWLGLQGEPSSQSGTYITSLNPQKDSSHEVNDCNKIRLLMERAIKNPNIPYHARL